MACARLIWGRLCSFSSTSAPDTTTAISTALHADVNTADNRRGGLTTASGSNGEVVALHCGTVTDSSLVSTSERAVTSGVYTSTDREYYAIYFVGLTALL